RPDGREGLVCLVAAGGDGTVGDLINRFPGVPLTILPLGTENLLARHLGIPCNGRFVAELIAEGITRVIDLGLLNGRRFTRMVPAAFDAELVHRVHATRRGNIRKANYIQPFFDTLRTYRYPKLRVTVDGEDPPRTGRFRRLRSKRSGRPLVGR